MEPTTFKELGLTFDFDPSCLSCQDGNCHNRVQSRKGDIEYSVHISTNREYTFFAVLAEENSNTDTLNTINKYFTRVVNIIIVHNIIHGCIFN